jgi:phosphatidylserine decarboxylase
MRCDYANIDQLRVGMSIGHHPHQHQYEHDMRKADADISESERAEAKRRIEGSIAPGMEGSTGLMPPTASIAG